MQIEIDFEVFKALTAMRTCEADSYNHVLRRLLNLPEATARGMPEIKANSQNSTSGTRKTVGGLAELLASALAEGVLYNGVFFPEGTCFRGNYKGRTFTAAIKDGHWVGEDGVVRTSPSDAASAISGTNVNGWRFWHAMRPGDSRWSRLDELK